MARAILIEAGVLNIALHPHSREIYINFMKDLFRARRVAQAHGDRKGVLSSLDTRREDQGILEGTLTTFLNVDLDGQWFDFVDLAEAKDADVDKVVIPHNIAPNSVSYFWQFDANTHKFYYQSYTDGDRLTPNVAYRLMVGWVSNLDITAKYNLANVSIVQRREGLDVLFGIKRIDAITINVQRPNPDIFSDDFEEKVEAHLEQTHSRAVEIRYTAVQGESIVPTPSIKSVSEAALENGHVEVVGRTDVGRVTLSTKSFPVKYQTKYDPDQVAEETAFRSLVNGSK
jgi:hypothetical protein